MLYGLSEELLQDDPSIRILARKVIPDSLINRWTSNISKAGLGSYLEAHYAKLMRRQNTCLYVEVRNATALYMPLANGETRVFLFTPNGRLLLEPSANRIFLKCFPIFANVTESRAELSISLEDIQAAIVTTVESPVYWGLENTNYLHFIADTIAPHLCMNGALYKISENSVWPLSLNSSLQKWQKELLAFAGLIQDPILHEHYMQNKCRTYAVRYSCIYMPVIESVPYRIHTFRKFVQETRIDMQKGGLDQCAEQIPIMLFDRYDNRSERIANKNEIISRLSDYGLRVINPASLSLDEKIRVFSCVRIFIAEGSSTGNFLFFSSQTSSMLLLADANLYTKPEFIIGGWPYFIATLENTTVMPGVKRGDIKGSPMGSSTYGSNKIASVVKGILNEYENNPNGNSTYIDRIR
jgi:hypothetical protein